MTVAFPTLKRGKTSSGLLALLVALAAIVLVGGVATLTTGSDGDSGGLTAGRPAIQVERQHLHYTLYLVDSQEQADLLQWGQEEAARERAAANIADPDELVVIYKVTKPEDELNVNEILDSWYTSEPESVRVIDQRR